MTETRTRHMLRIAADAAIMPNAPAGSAFLYAIAVAYLSAREETVADAALLVTLDGVAEEEGVESDEILSWLLMKTAD